MAKFSSRAVRPNVSHVVSASKVAITHQGGAGVEYEGKSALFLLAVTNMVSEETFYESAQNRDERFEQLVHQVTVEDPEWMQRFIPWLRNEANMRTASLVAAAEYVKAKGENGRQVAAAALQRADEPGEMLAYWHQRHGRSLPAAIKRGVADAVQRLYTERSSLKYDGQAKAWRFADVIELVHPKPTSPTQTLLFKYLLDKRHDRLPAIPDALGILTKDSVLQSLDTSERRGSLHVIADAGWTWERLSGWLPGGMDAEAWEAVIPQMGYFAMLRNLRNFDEAGVGHEAYERVVAKLTNPEEVAKSRLFPSRFLSAYKVLSSERWKYPLERALELSLDNVPALPGRTLILLDVSTSMVAPLSNKSDLMRWETAGVFAAALAKRAENADVWAYSWEASNIEVAKGGSIFSIVRQVRECPTFGGGTATWQTVREKFSGHDRVIILTDEQSAYGAADPGPGQIPLVYTFNLAGYQYGHGRTGDRGRYTFGGFSDHGLRAIPMLEEFKNGAWPWQND